MYKHVVHCVEKFIQKCRPEYKVPGLYVMDSIVRQARHQFPNEKEVFAPRFAKNIQATFKNLLRCRESEIPKLVRVLNLWQKNGIYSPSVIQPLLGMVAPRPGTRSSLSRTNSAQDPSLNAAEVVAANAVAIIQQQQTHIQALLQQQAQQQLANLSPNLLQNIQSLQSLLSNANIVTPIASAPAITANAAISIPLSSTLEKLKEAASSVLGLTGSTASGTAHSSSMADLEPAQEFKPKLKPHQLQHINQFLEQQETAQNHEYINEVNRPPPPPPPPPPVPDSQQRRMERNLREFEREHKISHRRLPPEAWPEKRSREFEGRVHELARHVQISDDEEGGVDMDVGTPSPPLFEDTTRSFLDDFDYGDDQGEEERIEEQKRRVSQERSRVAKLSERNRTHYPPARSPPHSPTQTSPVRLAPHAPLSKQQQQQQQHQQHEEKVGDSIPTISRIQLGSSRASPEKSQTPFLQNVVPINSSPHQPPPPVRLPWMDPSLRPPPALPMHQFSQPMLSALPPGLPPRHIFPPHPFIPPQQHRPPFPLPPPPASVHHQFRPHNEFPPGIAPSSRPPSLRPIHPRDRESYPSAPLAESPLRENSDSPRGAFSRWRHTPSPPAEARERDKKRQRLRREPKEPPYEYEERRRYRSRSRSPDRDKERERRPRKRQKSPSPVERKDRNKRRERSRSPRDKRKKRELETKERERGRVGRENEDRSSSNFYPSPPPKWKALDQVGQEHSSRQKEPEVEKPAENSKKEKDKKKYSFSLTKNKCISVLSTTIWVQIKKVTPNIERVIREKCEEFGRVLSFDLIPSRGCAYVDMATRESADMLVNEEREIKLGWGTTSKFVYAPGKGVKEESFKPHWDATHGITYLPWSIISSEEFDLSEFQEGGILDPDTLPPGVAVPEKRAIPETSLPTATIFMPLPPMIPSFPPNHPLPPTSASIIPPMGILPLPGPTPDSQLAQSALSEGPPLLSSEQFDPSASSPSLFPHLSAPVAPAEFKFNGEDLSGALPFPPPFRPPPAPDPSVRPDQELGPPRPEPFFRPPPPLRAPIGPRHPDLNFRPPPFPNMRHPSQPPHPDHRFRVPPPPSPPIRPPFPRPPYDFRFPPPRAHKPPTLRHEFRVPAPPAEHKYSQNTDSVNNTEKLSALATITRPSTPPGYSKGSPQKEALCDQPPDLFLDQTPESTSLPQLTVPSPPALPPLVSEETEQLSRPSKSLVAEYSDVYSPHSEEGLGETTELPESTTECAPSSPPQI